MPKVVVDLPEEYSELIAQICAQEKITQQEFFLRALDTFLSSNGFLPDYSVNDLRRARAIEIQEMLSSSDADYDCDSIQGIIKWRRAFANRE